MLFRKKRAKEQPKPLCFHKWVLVNTWTAGVDRISDYEFYDMYDLGCCECRSVKTVDEVDYKKMKAHGLIK